MRYSLSIAYLLWLFSGCGALGLHRFYLGKVGTGILWLCSGGLVGMGCLYDAVTMRRQVDEANFKHDYREAIAGRGPMPGLPGDSGSYPRGYQAAQAKNQPESVERIVLRTAKKNGGVVTPGEVAIEGDVSLEDARKALDKLAQGGNAEMRVRSSGVVVYVFPEFSHEGGDDYIA